MTKYRIIQTAYRDERTEYYIEQYMYSVRDWHPLPLSFPTKEKALEVVNQVLGKDVVSRLIVWP
jgi:hypothetical protein